MLLRKAFFLLLICYASAAFSQNVISGKLIDTAGIAVPFGNVSLLNNSTIIRFTQSDKYGNFKIEVGPLNEDHHNSLQVTSIGFKKVVVALKPRLFSYQIVLHAEHQQLKEVLIKSNPIPVQKKGDTTNFDLKFFKEPQDRVIEDVLKRLPGISIDRNGRISYKGKQITTLYVDGDNLLDDKYTLGTRSIPVAIVDTVQVFENHQPIRSLKKISPSNQVSLNLTLNPQARIKVTGQTDLGLATDKRVKEEAVLMSFKKEYKTLNTFKYNRAGLDLSKELLSQTPMGSPRNFNSQMYVPLLNVNSIATPSLSQNKYLDNQALLAATNQLFKLKKDIQFKVAAHYFQDRQRSDFSQITRQIVGIDTINFSEVRHQTFKPEQLQVKADLEINKEAYFFNNTLAFNRNPANTISQTRINSTPVVQGLSALPTDFYNRLKYIKAFKEIYAVEFSSYVSKSNNVEELNINPLAFNTFSRQEVRTPVWFANNAINLKIGGKPFFQEYKLEHTYRKVEINSDLTQANLSARDSLENRLSWESGKLLFSPSFKYKTSKLRLSLDLPLSYHRIQANDPNYQNDTKEDLILFEPQLYLQMDQGRENRITMQYQFQNDYGDANTQFQGYILSNYRTLGAYKNDGLFRSNTHNFSLAYNISKSIRLFSLNTVGTYSVKENNSITSIALQGFNQTNIRLPLLNYDKRLMWISSMSKYIFDWKTTVKANFSLQNLWNTQIINETLSPYKTNSYNYGLQIDKKISDQFYSNYSVALILITSRLAHNEYNLQVGERYGSDNVQRNRFMNQNMELVYIPAKPLLFKLNLEHQYYQNTFRRANNYLFCDASVSWKLDKIKSEVTFAAVNLTNVRSFKTNYLSAYTSVNSKYNLLSRFFQLNYRFNLN